MIKSNVATKAHNPINTVILDSFKLVFDVVERWSAFIVGLRLRCVSSRFHIYVVGLLRHFSEIISIFLPSSLDRSTKHHRFILVHVRVLVERKG